MEFDPSNGNPVGCELDYRKFGRDMLNGCELDYRKSGRNSTTLHLKEPKIIGYTARYINNMFPK